LLASESFAHSSATLMSDMALLTCQSTCRPNPVKG
jgi:hypothetical protein